MEALSIVYANLGAKMDVAPVLIALSPGCDFPGVRRGAAAKKRKLRRYLEPGVNRRYRDDTRVFEALGGDMTGRRIVLAREEFSEALNILYSMFQRMWSLDLDEHDVRDVLMDADEILADVKEVVEDAEKSLDVEPGVSATTVTVLEDYFYVSLCFLRLAQRYKRSMEEVAAMRTSLWALRNSDNLREASEALRAFGGLEDDMDTVLAAQASRHMMLSYLPREALPLLCAEEEMGDELEIEFVRDEVEEVKARIAGGGGILHNVSGEAVSIAQRDVFLSKFEVRVRMWGATYVLRGEGSEFGPGETPIKMGEPKSDRVVVDSLNDVSFEVSYAGKEVDFDHKWVTRVPSNSGYRIFLNAEANKSNIAVLSVVVDRSFFWNVMTFGFGLYDGSNALLRTKLSSFPSMALVHHCIRSQDL